MVTTVQISEFFLSVDSLENIHIFLMKYVCRVIFPEIFATNQRIFPRNQAKYYLKTPSHLPFSKASLKKSWLLVWKASFL